MNASSARTKKTNALVFFSIDSHEHSSEIGVRKPVSTTSHRLMPSTPRW